MKSFAVASVLFAAVAIAQPHGHQHRRHHQQHEKRELVTEIEWVTETQYVTKLVDSTTTVWVGTEAEATSTTEQAQFIETPKTQKKKTSTTSTSTTSTSSSVYVAPEPTTTSTTSTSIYVPPSSTVEEKESSTEVYVAPTTSVYVAPTSTYEAPAETTTASSGDDSSSGSGSYSGDITYYTIGLGSCGDDDSGLDNSVNVVALSAELMSQYSTGNSNTNKLCGKSITIKANGKTVNAVVKDTCPECEIGSIDVSEKIFNTLWGGLTKGRGECEWYFS